MVTTIAFCQIDLSYPDLVERLYDMKHLSVIPDNGERSGNFSSWDRGAQYDEKTGQYVNWHANRDGTGFMDENGTMMEMEGPGVIWRIWSALPEEGEIEILIDGTNNPIKLPFIEFFNNKEEPFNYPELVHMKARGQNFFIPIPFQESIRIRGEEGWGRYYQITYTKFPEGTTVPSFTGRFSESDRTALKKANDIWGGRGPAIFAGSDADIRILTIELAPGEEKILTTYDGPAAITSIILTRPEMDRDASVDILRELTISITWDDDGSPAVWAPIGDFFGTGAGENLYKTLATGMTDEVYYCNWYMPFRKARLVIRNDGKQARKLDFKIHTEKIDGNADQLLRFHCKWQRDDFSGFDRDRFMADRWPDWPVLKIDEASGRFVGFLAHMWNPNHNWIPEYWKHTKPVPKGAAFAEGSLVYDFYKSVVRNHYWWGEGDEKFFVDGEKMPSTFGTGTEDYFGYAWGTSEAFESALQAQPLNGSADEIGKQAPREGPGNIGHIVNLRWQIPDNIPFQKSFEAVIEKYHPNEWPLLNAYTVSWYQSAGTDDHYQPVPVEDRTDYYDPAGIYKPVPVERGRYEAEEYFHLKFIKAKNGRPMRQDMSIHGRNWSNDEQLLFRTNKDNEMVFSFKVEEETSSIAFVFTKGNNYGIYKIHLDGEMLGKAIDLFNPEIMLNPEIRFENVKLSQGEHELKFINDGKNEKSSGYYFGLDFIQIGR
jgi:hypothetical protein